MLGSPLEKKKKLKKLSNRETVKANNPLWY